MTVPVEKQALAERLKAAGLTSRDGTFVHASTREVVETVAALRSPVEAAGEPVAWRWRYNKPTEHHKWHYAETCPPDLRSDYDLEKLYAIPSDGNGWVFWNPDSGEEYSPNHPVESGECEDAKDIRKSTAQEDVLWRGMQEEFRRAQAAESQAQAAARELEEARAALEPFAKVVIAAENAARDYGFDHQSEVKDSQRYGSMGVYWGDLRRAARILSALSIPKLE